MRRYNGRAEVPVGAFESIGLHACPAAIGLHRVRGFLRDPSRCNDFAGDTEPLGVPVIILSTETSVRTKIQFHSDQDMQ